MTTYTEIQVIRHHFPTVGGISGDTLTDYARAQGLIYACLECGSVGGISPTDLGEHPTLEAARLATRAALGDRNAECCGTTILY